MKRTHEPQRTLILKRETVRTLTPAEADRVRGGDGDPRGPRIIPRPQPEITGL
ncbi:hypothetical protein [Haliangium sp.]|uniref:hypothetical protein n=1 Tax=Haliangium sp. TaxID=2663208 RepID=UPI003D0B6B96